MTRDNPSHEEEHDRFAETIEEKEQRKMKARRNKPQSLWFGLGMFGMIGWSVAIPTLIGVAVGLWIDSRYPGQVSWTVTGLVAGVIVGSLIAWRWVKEESERD
ncbi:ATPase F0F1 [candidate division KSB3 bacterium]|uniref:ATPase F0F1 n=1 Tax=candidate division KSB3 bacterium TaxID=2044937 RepID=A0A9D5JT10_9BACT|nr:ATPase F0F1 [candidate division KSB3 bacterium]